MKALNDYNNGVPRDTEIAAGSHKTPDNWCGWRVRVMLQALYTITMLCLLRFGEALGLMWEDMKMEVVDGRVRLEIRLLVRKTHQNGGESCCELLYVCRDYSSACSEIAPFYLYQNSQKPWMCAVTAMARWYKLAGELGLPRMGYVFRKRSGRDGFCHEGSEQMVSPCQYYLNSGKLNSIPVSYLLPEMLPKQLVRYWDRPATIRDSFLPSWWLPVSGNRSSLAYSEYMYVGRLGTGF